MLPRLKIAALVFALAATAGLAAFAGTRDDAGMPTSQAGMAAPDFTGIDRWHNSAPLTLGQLHGKVVLVDFWTYSCINCIHTIPYVKVGPEVSRGNRRGRRAYARVSVRARRGQRRRCDQALRHPVSGRAGQPLRHVARVRQPVLARAVPDRREREGRLHPMAKAGTTRPRPRSAARSRRPVKARRARRARSDGPACGRGAARACLPVAGAHPRFASAAAIIASPIARLPFATSASPAPRISASSLFCPSLRLPTSRVISICSPTIACSIASR